MDVGASVMNSLSASALVLRIWHHQVGYGSIAFKKFP